MPRCKKHRRCRFINGSKIFKPAGKSFKQLEQIEIQSDEFEAIRLCNYDGLNQIQAGQKMQISRGTVQRLLSSGSKKIVDALLNTKLLIIKEKNDE